MTSATDGGADNTPGTPRAPTMRTASAPPLPAHMLPVGTRLRNYEVIRLFHAGAFGIVYLAFDHSLQRRIAIKEYMPVAIATRAPGASFVGVRSDHDADTYHAGLKSFLNEGRLLARFDHPSLVKVDRFWEENGTAYWAMPFYEGPTLKSALAELGHVPTESELRAWLQPILDAVTLMHEGGFYHQHIGADNIRLTETGPVLLDFAAARRVVEGRTQAHASSLKPGYAAVEQYGDGENGPQGAWTDLYALAALLYTAITGAPPIPAPERLAQDDVLKLRDAAATLYSDAFLEAIDAALSLHPENRPRDHAQFRALMRDIDAPNEAVAMSALRELMLEPFAVDHSRTPDERTVPDLPALVDLPSGTQPGGLELARSRIRSAGPASTALRRAEASPDPDPSPLPRSARSVAADTHSAPIDLDSDADLSRALEPTHFGFAAKAGLAVVTLVAGGLSMWLFKLYDDRIERANAPLVAAPGATSAILPPLQATTASPVPDPTASMAMASPRMEAPDAAPPTQAADSSADRPPTLNAANEQAQCVEILQRASREAMKPADAAFYKKECQ